MLVFDIETEPLPEEQLLAIMPPFDSDSVALGNLKDPAKIAEKLAEKEASHRRKFVEDAAFNANTARVLAIGYHSTVNGKTCIQATDEEKMIVDFWGQASKMRAAGRSIVGVNITGFDLPFLCRRSWLLGLDVPTWVRVGRYWDRAFIDLCETWRCGQQWQEAPASFNALAGYFGTDAKPEGCDGAIFYQVWRENRELAIRYLTNDVQQPAKWAARMGIIK
jgi:hypothetical protein